MPSAIIREGMHTFRLSSERHSTSQCTVAKYSLGGCSVELRQQKRAYSSMSRGSRAPKSSSSTKFFMPTPFYRASPQRPCVRVHVCVQVCVYKLFGNNLQCVYVRICLFVRACACLRAFVHQNVHVCVKERACACVCSCLYACMYVCMYVCMCS